MITIHCVKSVSIRSYSGPYLLVLRMTTVKYGPEITLYLDTIHAVKDAENAVQ